MFHTSRRLDDHIRECGQRHSETLKRIADLSDQTRGEFGAVKIERDRMHAENEVNFTKLYGGLWKAVALVGAAVLAQYLAAHGFNVPGGH